MEKPNAVAVNHPFQIIGYHSCDRDVGLSVLNGEMDLKPSNNSWDWLGPGIYFWEHDPLRSLTYAIENAKGAQFNSQPIEKPFVLGAIIELGNCLNLVESESLEIIAEAYIGLQKLYDVLKMPMPLNNGDNRSLDCEVIKFIHQANKMESQPGFQTVRSAFQQGDEVYPGASFSARHHLQVCVLDKSVIKGYFLPRPIEDFNPNLH